MTTSRIPCYYLEEASKALIPLLGDKYHSNKERWFIWGLWQSFTECQWVEPDASKATEHGKLWYKGGPSPPPETEMAKRGWFPFLSWRS